MWLFEWDYNGTITAGKLKKNTDQVDIYIYNGHIETEM